MKNLSARRRKAKVQEEREKLETYEQMMAQVKERLEGLKAKRETKNS